MRPDLSANRPASYASSGGWGGASSAFGSKARSYKGTTSDEESESDNKHLDGHGDEKKQDGDHIPASEPNTLGVPSPLSPTSSSSKYQTLAANAPQASSKTEDNQHLKPPVVNHDHDTSSDEDRSHKIPGAFIWTPTKPKFKKLHPR
jgi:hypothetical protein